MLTSATVTPQSKQASKTVGQQREKHTHLAQSPHNRLPTPVEHPDPDTDPQEFPQALPTHPTWTRRLALDVRRHGQRAELPVPQAQGADRRRQRTALGAQADWVRGVFDVGAGDVGVHWGGGQEGGADVEVGVGAFEQR